MDVRYYWNPELNDWSYNKKFVYSYDENGYQILYINYYWDSEINNWAILEKCEYSFDTYGNQTLFIENKWNTKNNTVHETEFEYGIDNFAIATQSPEKGHNS